MRHKESYPAPLKIKIPASVPFLTAKAEVEVYAQFMAQISGTVGVRGHVTQMVPRAASPSLISDEFMV